MNYESFIVTPFMHSLGWTLLHFIWQGALIAALLFGILALLRGRSANARYIVSVAAMLLMLAAPVVSFLHLSATFSDKAKAITSRKSGQNTSRPAGNYARRINSDTQAMDEHLKLAELEQAEMLSLITFRRWIREWLTPYMNWLVLIWFSGVAILSVRMLCGWVLTRRIKKRGLISLADEWQNSLIRLAGKIGVSRHVSIYKSAFVEVPTVIGWMRPVILLPMCALTGLSPQQLEAIIAHELAHIRRHDYLVNLLQTFIETVLFYHPAVWWVSNQIRIEREHACDDMVVDVTDDLLCYARALTKLEGLRQSLDSHLALAADGGSLLHRIRRLIEGPEQPKFSSSFLGAFLIVFSLALTCVGAIISEERYELARAVDVQIESLRDIKTEVALERDGTGKRDLSADVKPEIARDDTSGENLEMRRVTIDALGAEEGTVIIMDPMTGRIFTIVNQDWALRRGWNPASTVKLITALAAIEEKAINPAQKIRVSAKSGLLDLTRALALSDSSYFSFVGKRVGVGNFLSYAQQFGLGEQTGINHANEIAGHLPTYQTEIDAGRLCVYGEGIEVTPIQLASMIAAIANGGKLLVPRVPQRGEDAAQFSPRVRRRIEIRQESLRHLIDGMIGAVNSGTAKLAYDPTQTIAGKTGTSAGRDFNTGLFASYSSAERPHLLIVVATQGANVTGPAAAEIAGKIYRGLNRS